MFRELGVGNSLVLRARSSKDNPLAPIDAWDLSAIRQEYIDFVAEHRPTLMRIKAGSVTAVEALIYRTRLMDQWRQFLKLDPDLPDEVLPEDWPRNEGRETFATLYDALGELAVIRARQVVSAHGSDLRKGSVHVIELRAKS